MNLQSIPTHLIQDDGLGIDETLDPKALSVDVQNVHFKGKLALTGEMSRVGKDISVGIRAEGVQNLICSRCLENFDRQFEKDMVFTIEINGKMSINLLPFLREEIVVEYPIQALCSEACKGLCASCGANRNQDQCNCQES